MLEKFVQYFTKRHLLTNLIFVIVIIGGIFAWNTISKEELPDVTFDVVRITAHYPGATAEEVEYFITRPIEEELQGVDGIYLITSTASQATTTISVELEQNYPNKDEAIMEIRNAVLDVKLPDEVLDQPTIRVFKTSKKAIIDIALFDQDAHLLSVEQRQRLQEYAHTLETQLISLPEINSVNRSGYLQEELQIKVDPKKLIAYAIPLSQVSQEIRNNHIRQPAGNIETKNEPKVTLNAQLDTKEKLQNQVIQAGFQGQAITLNELAYVDRGFNHTKEILKVNGREAVILNVVKNSSFDIIQSIQAVHKLVHRFKKNRTQDTPINIVLLDDESVDVRDRLSIVSINGALGFALILICLFIFLDKRSGLWVAMGIPFSICFTLICTKFFGYTINNITLAAVIIVMGMVVDDAIVVCENISRLRLQGIPTAEASIKGTAEVFLAVVASILTTCIAFVPLYFFTGRFGKMIHFIPLIIFLMLGASLFESLIILPGHMNLEWSFLTKLKKKRNKEGQQSEAHWFDRVESAYGRFLTKILPYKMIILVSFICLLIISLLIAKNTMKFVMFPNEETQEIVISGQLKNNADRFETAETTRQIEEILMAYVDKQVVGIRTGIARSRRGGAVEEDKFRIMVEIVPREQRKESANDLIKIWKKEITNITSLKDFTVDKSRWGQASGSPIEIVVQENNDPLRTQATQQLAHALEQYPELINVEIEEPILIPEYKIYLQTQKLKRLSINASHIASAFRSALEGTVLYEIPKGDETVDARLTVIDEAKINIENVLDIPVENQQEYLVPLRDVVVVEKTTTANSISRRNQKRTTIVYADLKPQAQTTPVEIAQKIEDEIFPEILAQQATTTLGFIGEVQDTRDSGKDFQTAIILVCFLIFAVLAVLFNSLTRPLIIMLAIPFGVVGIILAFWLHGKTLFGFFATIGALGLAGVVINDSIVLLTKLDAELRSKTIKPTHQDIAVITQTRLRAVLLTTITTVAGLFPTAYGIGGYDATLAEMMLALSWGLCFGTLITLVLIPCIYSLMDDIKFSVARLRN